MARYWMIPLVIVCLSPGTVCAKVDADVVAQYEKVLEGKTVVAAADIKLIKILKQVRGDQRMGMTGGENLEQTKDATVVTPKGVQYASEARSREWIYAPKGLCTETPGCTSNGRGAQ